MNKIITVNDPSLAGACGAVVYWSIQGMVNYDHTCSALKALGLGDEALPPRMTSGKCLTLALEETHTSKGGVTKVMPVKGKASGTIGLYKHSGGAGRSEYACLWCVSADEQGKLKFEDMAEAHDIFDVELVTEAFSKMWGQLLPSDVGSWLAKVVRSPLVHGLGLRDHGGIYFVPPATKSVWTSITNAISSVQLFQIPAMNGPDAIAAVMASLGEEAQRLSLELLEIKRKANSEDEGVRGPRQKTLDRMAVEAAAGLQKITMYEQLLGMNLDALRKQVSDAMVEKDTADVLSL